MNDHGFWRGELSSSALATAVAIVSLKTGAPESGQCRIGRGIQWLTGHINPDGGFGDSPNSCSNVSTTLLSYAALRFCSEDQTAIAPVLSRVEQYLEKQCINVNSPGLIDAVLNYYGKDYTFSVPILSMLAICSVLDEDAFQRIPQLPFEFSLLPSSFYRFFNLQVVSYAIPALVGVGIYIFRHRRKKNLVYWYIRQRAIVPALRKLLRMVPESGGFLEAVPLTAFVSMCLVSAGFGDHPVVAQGLLFIERLQRTDGSWPIDTDLSTWVTTLGIKALGSRIHHVLPGENREILRSHLLKAQVRHRHPFNDASPGGWGWTDYTGSVPDADDTAGAILALLELSTAGEQDYQAVMDGCSWLARLQNNDGGIPTFCRGWGKLPFDRSCCDLTGHALLAWVKTLTVFCNKMSGKEIRRLTGAIHQALLFLQKQQHQDGYWLPLWFGNQLTAGKTNPVYGTARVMAYLQDALACGNLEKSEQTQVEHMLISSRRFLSRQQNSDGSWGAEKGITGSIEETSLAVCALSGFDETSCNRGFRWLGKEYLKDGLNPQPIGLYFASLWYHEKMYPLVFYLEALRRFLF